VAFGPQEGLRVLAAGVKRSKKSRGEGQGRVTEKAVADFYFFLIDLLLQCQSIWDENIRENGSGNFTWATHSLHDRLVFILRVSLTFFVNGMRVFFRLVCNTDVYITHFP